MSFPSPSIKVNGDATFLENEFHAVMHAYNDACRNTARGGTRVDIRVAYARLIRFTIENPTFQHQLPKKLQVFDNSSTLIHTFRSVHE